MEYKEFQTSIAEKFFSEIGIPKDLIDKEIKNFEKEYSLLKYNLLVDKAISLYRNSTYFPLRKRMRLAIYLVVGR